MRLIALVEGFDHVCCRYRLSAFRAHLEAGGHSLELLPRPRRWSQWPGIFKRLRQSDVLIVQRLLFHPVILNLLRSVARFLVFDFDDAIFMNDSYDRRASLAPVRRRRFNAMINACDAIVAGNEFLKRAARPRINRCTIQVIPTCVNLQSYSARLTKASSSLEMVWIGSSSTLQGLERRRELFEMIGCRHAGVSLRLICDRFMHLKHLPVKESPWQISTEADELARADVGITWLPDDRWSRGKCGLKVLQYMAAGLPTIANPVGVQAELVRHGETGFLATTSSEWCRAISKLRDASLRQQLGSSARQVCADRFDVSVGARQWLELLADLPRLKKRSRHFAGRAA